MTMFSAPVRVLNSAGFKVYSSYTCAPIPLFSPDQSPLDPEDSPLSNI